MDELHPSDPRHIGSYWLLGRLGSGGMGQVFLGQSPGGRLVAVKVIRPELADGTDFRSRFAREVAAARRVSGVFTAPVVDADPDAPQPWLVTAYVDGPSLASDVELHGAMPESDVIRLGGALAEGLSAIHAAAIVHRDLKPSNVLLASDGPRIIDFGISRPAEATSLTQTGVVVGSPGFMSPEQADGREVSVASDVFSLGAVLAFAATGTNPFGSGAASALMYRVVHTEPDLTGISGELCAVLRACLRKNPVERPTPGGLLAMLVSISNGQPLPAHNVAASTSILQHAGAGGPHPEPPFSRTTLRGGAARPMTAATLAPVPASEFIRRRRRWPWIAVCAVIALAAGGGAALAFHGSGTHKPPRAESPGTTPTTTTQTAQTTPRAVVESYFAAINAHDWRKVWRLGGKNMSTSYSDMVAGFQNTSHDKITHLSVRGGTVTVRLRAYETTGAVQVYVDTYTVRGSVIASGTDTLLTTSG